MRSAENKRLRNRQVTSCNRIVHMGFQRAETNAKSTEAFAARIEAVKKNAAALREINKKIAAENQEDNQRRETMKQALMTEQSDAPAKKAQRQSMRRPEVNA
eukprot:c9364_g1_i1.p1 GENE.c9364_g1_i1~~c9364_g1_i1.p1  ORF type:complete len:102 (+),score=16.12 c9364_g1_i1:50-355(+)